MEQLTLPEYQERKQRIKDRLNQTVENFIVIGYELRQIRDTEAFRMDGYSNLADFAKAEFNLSRDTVSRFISINIKLTVDGDGVELLPELKGLGYSKLQDVLQLPADDYQLLTPQTTVKEIRDLKKFNHSDATAERLSVPLKETALTPLRRCIKDFFSAPGHRSLLNGIIWDAERPDYGEAYERKIAEEMNPTGTRTHQKGLIYLFLYDYSRGVSYKQMGKPQPVTMSWHDFIEEIRGTFAGLTDEKGETWSNAFGQVQEEADIPGQMSIEDVESATSQPKENKTAEEQKASKGKAEQKPEKAEQKPEKTERKPEKRSIPDPKIGMTEQELKLMKAAVVYIVEKAPALTALDDYFVSTVSNVILQLEPTGYFLMEGTTYQIQISRDSVQIYRGVQRCMNLNLDYFATEVSGYVLEQEEKKGWPERTAEESDSDREIPAAGIRELPKEETMDTDGLPMAVKQSDGATAAVAGQNEAYAAAAVEQDEASAAAVMDPDNAGERMVELWEQAKMAETKLALLFSNWELKDVQDDTLRLIHRNAINIADNIESLLKLKEITHEEHHA